MGMPTTISLETTVVERNRIYDLRNITFTNNYFKLEQKCKYRKKKCSGLPKAGVLSLGGRRKFCSKVLSSIVFHTLILQEDIME